MGGGGRAAAAVVWWRRWGRARRGVKAVAVVAVGGKCLDRAGRAGGVVVAWAGGQEPGADCDAPYGNPVSQVAAAANIFLSK